MVAVASQNYHIRSCKILAKSIYHGCINYRKLKVITYNQVMALLPENRTKPGHPFMNTGIDYAGPVLLRMERLRKPVYVKDFICVFVSVTVKAMLSAAVSSSKSLFAQTKFE